METCIIQGSEIWKKWRMDKICGSDAPILMGESKYCTPMMLWKRKLGLEPEQEMNSSMQRGKDLEETVRSILDEKGLYFFPAVVVHPKIKWLGASLDGINLNNEIIEIKCINKKDHEGAINGKVPFQYQAQLQHQMYVCEVDKVLYISYYPEHIKQKLIMFHVERNDKYIEKLLEKEKKFYDCLVTKTPPEDL